MSILKIGAKLKNEGVVNCLIDAAYKPEYRQEMRDGYQKIRAIHAENRAQKKLDRENRKQERAQEKQRKVQKQNEDEYKTSLEYASAFLQRLDGVKRRIIEYDNSSIMVKVASRDELYDDKLKKYNAKISKSQLCSRNYNDHKLFIKIGSSYSQIFSAERYGNDAIILNLRHKDKNKQNLEPDFAMIKFEK